MKQLFYISTRRETAYILNHTTTEHVPVLNETLRPHIDDPEMNEGDLVHADLETARLYAKDVVFDLGDKSINVLIINVEDALYNELLASGDIRDSKHTDAYKGRLLKLSQHACKVINSRCGSLEVDSWVVPASVISGMDAIANGSAMVH